jgi:hypothetical protein
MQKTANQIKSEFELLASGHYQIHSFLYAQEFEQQAYENLIYPLMLVYPLGGNLSGTTYTRNYRVIIADRVLKSEGNELEVESDTQLIALDTLAYWMKLGTNERFSITSSNTITPFWEKWGDEVTGHFVDIGIEEFYDFNSCAIPLSSAIPSPSNPCKDARILINSVVYGNAPSDTNFNVVVKDQLGALVGSLIGGEWIVNTGGACADATYTIEDSLGNVLYTGTIPSGGTLTQAISNSTLNVNNSAGSLISSRSIVAQGTSSYNVADSVAVIKDSAGTTLKSENILATASENITINDSVAVIKDSANNTLKSENILAEATENISISDSVAVIKNSVGTTLKSENILAEATENITINDSSVENSDATYSVDVLAEGSLILPDSQINVNSVDSGDVVSVKTIDVNLEDSLGAPVVPTSVGLVGNTLTIEVPSGGGSYDIDTADRFGNILPTIIVSADTTLNWNSYDYADLYLSRLVNPPTGAQLTAVYTFFDDLITAGILQKATAIYPIIGGTSDDHKWNARYPYDKSNSPNLKYFGSPTHNANGISTNGTTNLIQTCFMPKNLPLNNKQVSIYKRNQTFNPAANQMYFQAGTNNPKFYSIFHLTNNTLGLYTDSSFFQTTAITAAESQGLISLRRNAASGTNAQSLLRNGSILRSSTTAFEAETDAEINIGGGVSASNTIVNGCPLDCSYIYIGEALSSAEETDHYNIVNALQTALSRNV